MFNQADDKQAHLNFISSFVDSATIGTFIEDLRRIKRESHTIRAMPRNRFDRSALSHVTLADTAAAAA